MANLCNMLVKGATKIRSSSVALLNSNNELVLKDLKILFETVN